MIQQRGSAHGTASLYAHAHHDQGGDPQYIPMAFADKLCGIMLASAIGMALFRRERTGQGEAIHLPMFESVLAFNMLDHMWTAALDGGPPGEQAKIGYPRMFTPHRRPFPTKDGHICLLATTDVQWQRLFREFDHPELAQDPRFLTLPLRSANIDALYVILANLLGAHTTAECQRRLEAADVPSGPMADITRIMSDPYVMETGFFQPMPHPTEGPTITPSIPVSFADSPGAIRLPAPTLGQHTASALRTAGCDEATINAVIAEKPPPR